MSKKSLFLCFGLVVSLVFGFTDSPGVEAQEEKAGSTYADLEALFFEFREFAEPKVVSGVPDYSAAAMNEQARALSSFQQRLSAFDLSGWPIPHLVDYHIVRAEMNGLEFYQRVLRPWARDPCFYSLRPGMTDPFGWSGAFRVPRRLPLSSEESAELLEKLRAVQIVFKQAPVNLTEAAGDLAFLAMHYLDGDSAIMAKLAAALRDHHPDIVPEINKARAAIDDYHAWLKDNYSRMTASAGIGVADYNWWLKYVHLFPYTWEECRNIVELEDNRVITFLKLEENRNRRLPPLKPVSSQGEYKERVKEALDHVLNFIREEEIFTVQDYLDLDGYWDNRKQAFDRPWPEAHDYFKYFAHREPVPEETHEAIGHDFEWQRLEHDDRSIRGTRRLYFIEWIRDEGWAFGLEELLMHAGYLDERPRRGREIVYQQAAFRTCRALADLRMHSRELSLQEAMDFCVGCAPHGELLDNSPHLWNEMKTTLRIPGWHMGMVVGKAQFIKLFHDRAQQLGDQFVLKDFLDEFLGAGFIPMSLIRWELTGYDDEIRRLTQ